MSRGAVIVGGGVIGAATAYYMSKAGWRVTILDRGRFGGACSHGNCGYICPSHVLPLAAPGAIWNTLKTLLHKNSPLKVRPSAVLRNLGWFLGFARRCNQRDMLANGVGIAAMLNSSRALTEALVRDESLACEWDAVGLMFVFQKTVSFDHYDHVDELLREKFGTVAKRFTADELYVAEPAIKLGSVAGGYLYENDVQVRPDRLMSELRRVLLAAGVTIMENATVTGFRVENGRVLAVRTTTGDVPADVVVLAAGAVTPTLTADLGCNLPIVPGKGYSLTYPRPEPCPKYPMIFEDHRVAVSPFQTGYRIGSTMEFAGYDESLNRSRLKLLTDGAAVYLDSLTGPPQEEWWGWRPMTPDGKPVIDYAPKAANVLIAAGHGMLGLSMAAGTGKLVAEMLSGDTPHIDPSHYSLGRFG